MIFSERFTVVQANMSFPAEGYWGEGAEMSLKKRSFFLCEKKKLLSVYLSPN